MKSLIILIISTIFLTGCGSGAAKLFSKFIQKNATKLSSNTKSVDNTFDLYLPPSGLIRCGTNILNKRLSNPHEKNCNQSS